MAPAHHTAPQLLPTYRSVCARRRLVLVDIENFTGGAHMTVADVVAVRRQVLAAIELQPLDQVVVGSCPTALMNVMVGWPDARHVVGSGVDGADQALLEVLTDESVQDRFAELVLASGDHIFHEAIARSSLPTVVLSRRGSLSSRLRLAANTVRLLPTSDREAA